MINFEFGHEQASQLIDTMQVTFGGAFKNQMGNVNPAQIETIIVGALYGITEQQFNTGLAQLSLQRYCPNIAEFRALCMAGSWMTVDEAWARVCEYTKDRLKTRITTLAKYAFDQVEFLITNGNMKEASTQFRSIYNALLLKAQMQGKHQEWYSAPKALPLHGFVEQETPTQKSGLNEEQKRIQVMTMQLISQGMNPKEAFTQSQLAVRGEVKEMAKVLSEKKVNPLPDTDFWPDPFDNIEQYKANLMKDGKAVPSAVKKWEMTLAQMVEKRRAMMGGENAA